MNRVFVSGVACRTAMWVLAVVTGSAAQVPHGYEVVRLTNSPEADRWPRINNHSEVTWTELPLDGSPERVLLFSRGRIVRVTDSTSRNRGSHLNNHQALAAGQGLTMVWMHYSGANSFDIQGLVNGVVTNLVTSPLSDAVPVLNDSGMLCWFTTGPPDPDPAADIYVDNGLGNVQQVTHDGLLNWYPEINNLGHITWHVMNPAVDPFLATLMLYRDKLVTPLTDGTTEVRNPVIDDWGRIVWFDTEGIKIWDAGTVTVVSGPGDGNPRINNHGDISFIRSEGGGYHIWIFRSGEFFRVSGDQLWNTDSDINDEGEVVFGGGAGSSDKDIYLLRRVPCLGDFDADGDVDFSDFGGLQSCFAQSPGGSVCSVFDIDHDHDIDTTDVTAFFEALGGPDQSILDCAE